MTSATTKITPAILADTLAKPLVLPCGAVLKNRIVKAAMSDTLGDGQGNATPQQARLYERWAQGGVALSLIGEVQSTPKYPERPSNLVLHPEADLPALQALARRGASHGAQLWVQLGHAGALSYAPISKPKGPSALTLDDLQCEGMSIEDIESLPAMYAKAALMAKNAGFGGVQIHAGHGFLLSQFLSPLFNRRTDDYGGSIEHRFRIVHAVIAAIRQAVGNTFPIGIKINASDQLQGGLTEEEALTMIGLIDATSIDLIDISGGTYFPGAAASSDNRAASGPYFIDFAKRAKQRTNIPVMATGGFKKRQQAVDALASGAVDMVGIARALVLQPNLANDWLSIDGGDPKMPRFASNPAGGVTAWYSMRLSALAEDSEATFDMDIDTALRVYEARDTARCDAWRHAFGNF